LRKQSDELLLKIRESGMPTEDEWTQFFDPEQVLSLLGVNHSIVDVADSQYLLQK
jgi:hypothetical protein